MNDTGRIILFLTVCMTVRLALAIFAKMLSPTYLPIMGILTLFVSAGFLYTFLFSKKPIGAFRGKLWWNNMRLVHSIIYLTFSVCAIMRKSWSWMILLFDVFVGLCAFLFHYFP